MLGKAQTWWRSISCQILLDCDKNSVNQCISKIFGPISKQCPSKVSVQWGRVPWDLAVTKNFNCCLPFWLLVDFCWIWMQLIVYQETLLEIDYNTKSLSATCWTLLTVLLLSLTRLFILVAGAQKWSSLENSISLKKKIMCSQFEYLE